MNNSENKKVDVHLFYDLCVEAHIDIREVIRAIEEAIELGYIDWQSEKEFIMRLIADPDPGDIFKLMTHAESLLDPLEAWRVMALKINTIEKEKRDKYEYYKIAHRCAQVENFILTLKLY
jgi:hypothetical protein